MFTYSTLAMICLIYAWYIGSRGMLLWPGVCYHAALSIVLVWAWAGAEEVGKRAHSWE